jgi:soluble lytic murein transglycosylase-like protein
LNPGHQAVTIRLVDILRQTAAAAGTKGGAESSGKAAQGTAFSDLLNGYADSEKTPGKPSVSPAMKAEILRLRMMRDALSLQDETNRQERSPSDTLVEHLLSSISAYRENSPAPAGGGEEALVTAPLEAEQTRAPSTQTLPDTPRTKHDFDPIIRRAARQFGVAPELIRAVIKAESNFNPAAVSPAGAQGLMQLMPGTARDLGVTNSFDPEQNIMAGTRYLRRLLDRYSGDLDSALAAYNWGPGNVDRKGLAVPRETRAYLARVKGIYSGSVG